MSSIPSRHTNTPRMRAKDVTGLIPDFPYNYGKLLENARRKKITPFVVDPSNYGRQVAVIGAGLSGITTAYELMRMGLQPVIFEATDRLGGRLFSMRRGSESNQTIAEMGAMRFPQAAKTVIHYFDKVGMSANKTPFPNPGSEAAISTMVDYKGIQKYYEPGDQEHFPTPAEYKALENKFIVKFLNSSPYQLDKMVECCTEPVTPEKQQIIKASWNRLLNPVSMKRNSSKYKHSFKNLDAIGKSWDDKSFLECLTDNPNWSFTDIEAFGQIGFGTGGWNTDFPNCFLEVLRVMYASLDVDHDLMYDGSDKLPKDLYSKTPSTFMDSMKHWPAGTTLQALSTQGGRNPFNQEVQQIIRRANGTFDVKVHNKNNDRQESYNFPAVIHAAPLRLLDKMRHTGNEADYQAMTRTLFDADAWEAIKYTHYMGSSKIFIATKTAFWRDRDGGSPARERMSITLSDRLTRGTYLVDYSGSAGKSKGPGIFLSYTWNDDSLKFLSGTPEDLKGKHVKHCLAVLKDIYPHVNFDEEIQSIDTDAEIHWENYPYYLGAFKNNLPGQYRYQRRIYGQFMDKLPGSDAPDPFVLVGDDVSWTAGWTEGAVTTAVNAVNKIAVVFDGGVNPDGGISGPMDEWDLLGPIEIEG